MRKKFTPSFRVQAVEKVFNRAEGVTVKDVAKSLGVGHSTLDKWIILARTHELEAVSEDDLTNLNDMINEKRPQDWSLQERLDMVIRCASLDEQKVSELCREQGLFPHHIKQWKQAFATGTTPNAKTSTDTKALKSENKALKKELNRKDKALAETAALLVLQKKVNSIWGQRRGRLTVSHERVEMINLIKQAQLSGARQTKACEIVGISAKTFQRWVQNKHHRDGRLDVRIEPANKLSLLERQCIIKIANSAEYAHLPPSKIVPMLADNGQYIASESSFYRILSAEKQLKHRQKMNVTKQIKKPRALKATSSNQVYSWDITYLPSVVKGVFFYLYLVMDIYSRKIVGWQVYEEESSALAADLMTDICQREDIKQNQITLHSDNGSPMKGATMLATLQALGIMHSFSRPSVSNDNPYSESLFRTLKYRPEYPDAAFENLMAARVWVTGFVDWYNNQHLHSAIKFVTPHQRHTGEEQKILENRKQVYKQAKLNNPTRWSGEIRNWDRINSVYLNPVKEINRAA